MTCLKSSNIFQDFHQNISCLEQRGQRCMNCQVTVARSKIDFCTLAKVFFNIILGGYNVFFNLAMVYLVLTAIVANGLVKSELEVMMYRPSCPIISHKFPHGTAHISAKIFYLNIGQIFLFSNREICKGIFRRNISSTAWELTQANSYSQIYRPEKFTSIFVRLR